MHETGRSQKSLLETMELLHLASPPHVLGRLLDACYDPTSTIDDLTKVIATDPALSCKLLMAVNSSVFSSNQSAINLKQTVSILGREHVKTLVNTSSIKQLFAGFSNSRFQFLSNFWLDSIYAATFAEIIAENIDYPHPKDAYLAGLMHDLGQIVFDTKFHQQYIAIIDSETEEEMLHKEIQEFGIDHAGLGANIVQQWASLHPSISDAIRFHHQHKDQLKGSDLLCQIIAESSVLASHWSLNGEADASWESTLVDGDQIEHVYQQVATRMSKIAASLDLEEENSTSITNRQLRKNIEKDNINLAQAIRDKTLIKALDSSTGEFYDKNSAAKLLLKITQEMQILFSLRDVVLLFPGGDENEHLTLHELNQQQPVSRFSLEGNNSEIIKSYLDGELLWIDAEESGNNNISISDQQIIRRLNHDIAISFPLINSENTIGIVVIGCDRVQREFLSTQSKLISNYLNNVAEKWQQNNLENIAQEPVDETKLIRELIHEISNPLSVIGNYIDIIKRKQKTDEHNEIKEIEILKEELQRVRHIINNFGNEESTQTQTLYLNNELKNCIPMYVETISEDSPVEISWDLDEADAMIKISRDSLRQIILNLVKNAIEAQSASIEIMISSHHFVNISGNTFAQFTIADKGNGVDAEIEPLLFTPLNSSKTGEVRGIGLSIVAELLDNFDGHIKYIENQFGGASFEVLVPLHVSSQSGN